MKDHALNETSNFDSLTEKIVKNYSRVTWMKQITWNIWVWMGSKTRFKGMNLIYVTQNRERSWAVVNYGYEIIYTVILLPLYIY